MYIHNNDNNNNSNSIDNKSTKGIFSSIAHFVVVDFVVIVIVVHFIMNSCIYIYIYI